MLIEVIIAFAVFTIAILYLMSAYSYAFTRVGERDDELQAVSFGQQYMEQVRHQIRAGATSVSSVTQPIDAGYPMVGGVKNYSSASPPPQLPSPGNFTASGTMTGLGTGGLAPYDVLVTVSWTWGGNPRRVTLESIVQLE